MVTGRVEYSHLGPSDHSSCTRFATRNKPASAWQSSKEVTMQRLRLRQRGIPGRPLLPRGQMLLAFCCHWLSCQGGSVAFTQSHGPTAQPAASTALARAASPTAGPWPIHTLEPAPQLYAKQRSTGCNNGKHRGQTYSTNRRSLQRLSRLPAGMELPRQHCSSQPVSQADVIRVVCEQHLVVALLAVVLQAGTRGRGPATRR